MALPFALVLEKHHQYQLSSAVHIDYCSAMSNTVFLPHGHNKFGDVIAQNTCNMQAGDGKQLRFKLWCKL